MLEFFRDVNCKKVKTLLCEGSEGVKWELGIAYFFTEKMGHQEWESQTKKWEWEKWEVSAEPWLTLATMKLSDFRPTTAFDLDYD